MDLKYKKSKGDLTLFLSGEIDEYSLRSLRDITDKVIDDNSNAKRVIFNLTDVSFMDSTGIGFLIGRYKKLKGISVPAYLSGASFSTERILELAGIYRIMPKC